MTEKLIYLIHLIPIIFGVVLIWGLVMSFEFMVIHIRYRGRMKRGIGIWSELLPTGIDFFLGNLSEDYVDQKTGAFIRKTGDWILIRAFSTKPFWKLLETWYLALPYVAFVDLRQQAPRIQYRVPITSFLFYLLVSGVLIWNAPQNKIALLFLGVLVSLLAIHHYFQKTSIKSFLYDKM